MPPFNVFRSEMLLYLLVSRARAALCELQRREGKEYRAEYRQFWNLHMKSELVSNYGS